MTIAFTLTDAERARIDSIDALVALGGRGVAPLIQALDDPSWTVRRAAIAGLAALGDEAVPELCTWLRTARTSEHAIAAAVDALAASRGAHVVDEVSGLLGDPRPAVVADGAVILGRRRAADARGALVGLLAHTDDNVAVAAIEALGMIGDSIAFDALAALIGGRDFFRTFAALQVISTSGDPRAVAVIGAFLEDPMFRDEAIRALGKTGSVQAIAPLAQLLDDTSVVAIACALAELLTRATWEGADAQVAAELAARLAGSEQRFVAALAEASGDARRAIVAVLGKIGDADAIPALGSLLGSGADAHAATRAIQEIATRDPAAVERLLGLDEPAARAAALRMVGMRGAAPAVMQMLDDEDPEVRALACGALARIGASTAVPALFDALADASPRVAHAAAAAINSLGSDQTAALAAQAVRSPNGAVRRHALRIFGYLGLPGAFEAARDALADSDPKVAEVAIGILGALEDPRADEVLAELARHTDEQLRVAAVRAVAHRPTRSMDRVLEAALADPSPWVRYHACQGLGRQSRSGSAALVIARLADPMPQVRIAAIEALAFLRTPEAWHALRDAARSPDPDQQRAALSGLGLHDREAALEYLLAGAASPDRATRLVALAALAPARSQRALAALVEAARDPAREIRDAAVSLLAERDDREAADALVELALATPPEDPAHAALARPGAARVAAIAARLADARSGGATVLAAALARMHSHDATEALFGSLVAAEPLVRRTAAALLVASGAPGALPRIARLAREDPDPEVRQVCIALLGE